MYVLVGWTGVTVVGVRGHLVAVEAHVGRRLPSLASADENDFQGSPFDAAVMQAMQALGMSQERLEFLGLLGPAWGQQRWTI
jgi:hypothetical protein